MRLKELLERLNVEKKNVKVALRNPNDETGCYEIIMHEVNKLQRFHDYPVEKIEVYNLQSILIVINPKDKALGPTIEDNCFGQRLKEVRLCQGYTRKQFADYIGIPETTLRNYELGTRKPNIEKLVKLSKLLDVSLDWLVGISENQ